MQTVVQVGSGGKNAGILYVGSGTVTAGVPAIIYNTIEIGKNLSQQLIYTVPIDKVLELKYFRFTPVGNPTIQFHQKANNSPEIISFDLPLNNVPINFESIESIFVGGNDVWITAASAATSTLGVILTGRLRTVQI
jgi:hypothetical protein